MIFHLEQPKIIEEPNNVTASIGETVSLRCRATGDPMPDIVWMQNSVKVPMNSPRYHLSEDGTLQMEANTDSVGDYECMAQNVVGEAKSRPVRMAINYQGNVIQRRNDGNRPRIPKITLKPVDVTVSPTKNIVLHCVATGE